MYNITVNVSSRIVRVELRAVKDDDGYKYHGLGDVVLATKLVIDNMTISEIRTEVVEAVKAAIDCSGKEINIELNF